MSLKKVLANMFRIGICENQWGLSQLERVSNELCH